MPPLAELPHNTCARSTLSSTISCDLPRSHDPPLGGRRLQVWNLPLWNLRGKFAAMPRTDSRSRRSRGRSRSRSRSHSRSSSSSSEDSEEREAREERREERREKRREERAKRDRRGDRRPRSVARSRGGM